MVLLGRQRIYEKWCEILLLDANPLCMPRTPSGSSRRIADIYVPQSAWACPADPAIRDSGIGARGRHAFLRTFPRHPRNAHHRRRCPSSSVHTATTVSSTVRKKRSPGPTELTGKRSRETARSEAEREPLLPGSDGRSVSQRLTGRDADVKAESSGRPRYISPVDTDAGGSDSWRWLKTRRTPVPAARCGGGS